MGITISGDLDEVNALLQVLKVQTEIYPTCNCVRAKEEKTALLEVLKLMTQSMQMTALITSELEKRITTEKIEFRRITHRQI